MNETPMEAYARSRGGLSRASYLWGVLVLVGGIGLFVYVLVSGIFSLDEGLTRLTVPGEHAVALEPAAYTVFYEHRSVLDGRTFATPQAMPPIKLEVERQDEGQAIPVTAASGSAKYSIGAREGRSVLAFTIPAPGTYVIRGDYAGEEGPEIVLAIGSEFVRTLVTTILGGLAILFGSIALAVLWFVRVSRLREAAV